MLSAGYSDRIPCHTVTMACISSNVAMTTGKVVQDIIYNILFFCMKRIKIVNDLHFVAICSYNSVLVHLLRL